MIRTAHAIAATLAMLLVAAFLGGTVIAEMMRDEALILETKRTILYGICFLIPAMAITGGSGFSLAGGRAGGVVEAKKKRMRLAAANGLIVMLPCAIWLYLLASEGRYEASFVVVQMLEIAGGFLQIYLLGRNFRDGLRLSGHLRRAAPHKTKAAG